MNYIYLPRLLCVMFCITGIAWGIGLTHAILLVWKRLLLAIIGFTMILTNPLIYIDKGGS